MTKWTDAKVAKLRELWAEGVSASQIAKQLGRGITRNAVIGKAHRLNLPEHALTVRTSDKRAKAA